MCLAINSLMLHLGTMVSLIIRTFFWNLGLIPNFRNQKTMGTFLFHARIQAEKQELQALSEAVRESR